jgi:dTDP-4-dehydrorhamnose 3,5-epimerase-like enzyme
VRSIEDCRIIQLPSIADDRGTLSVAEAHKHVPFAIQRVFYVYGLGPGKSRGAHAHKTLHEVVICLSGGMDVTVDDGRAKKTYRLEDPARGLYLPPMIWAHSGNYTEGALLLALASQAYDASDYHRDYAAYTDAMRAQRG